MNRRVTLLTGCSLAILAAALLWIPPRDTADEVDSRAKPLARASPGAGQVRARPDSSKGLPAPQVSPYATGSTEHDSWVSKRCEELDDLGWLDDEDSFKAILAELKNPDAEIREAALGAVGTFGSRDAIPHLEGVAKDTEDPAEKLALLKMAENLKLPSATEYFASKKEKTSPDGP